MRRYSPARYALGSGTKTENTSLPETDKSKVQNVPNINVIQRVVCHGENYAVSLSGCIILSNKCT